MPYQIRQGLRADRFGRITTRWPIDVESLHCAVQRMYFEFLSSFQVYNQTRVGIGIFEVIKDAGKRSADFIVAFTLYQLLTGFLTCLVDGAPIPQAVTTITSALVDLIPDLLTHLNLVDGFLVYLNNMLNFFQVTSSTNSLTIVLVPELRCRPQERARDALARIFNIRDRTDAASLLGAYQTVLRGLQSVSTLAPYPDGHRFVGNGTFTIFILTPVNDAIYLFSDVDPTPWTDAELVFAALASRITRSHPWCIIPPQALRPGTSCMFPHGVTRPRYVIATLDQAAWTDPVLKLVIAPTTTHWPPAEVSDCAWDMPAEPHVFQTDDFFNRINDLLTQDDEEYQKKKDAPPRKRRRVVIDGRIVDLPHEADTPTSFEQAMEMDDVQEIIDIELFRLIDRLIANRIAELGLTPSYNQFAPLAIFD